jgi:hypothetical protein
MIEMNRIRKIAVVAAAALFCMVAMAACSNSNTTSGDDKGAQAQNQGQAQEASGGAGSAVGGFEFTKSGVTVAMNAPAADLVEKLGSYSYFESASCAFNGLDKQYDYGSFVLTTYPIDEVDYVNSVELKDDLVKTAEGVAIGSSEDDVKNAYGDPATAGDYSYTKGDSKLLFVIKDGSVSSIQYIAVTK